MNALTAGQRLFMAREAQFANAATHPDSLLLVEDHPFFIDGLTSAIKQLYPDVELKCATSASDAKRLLEINRFDLVFLDLQLPDQDGFELLDELKNARIIQPIVILTGLVTVKIADLAQKKGASGAISKSITVQQLGTYCQQLLDGKTVFMPDALQLLSGQKNAPLPTSRELDVLSMLDEGLENAEICSRIHVSDSTLRTHLRNLFGKLCVSNRTACVAQARKFGWL